MAKHPKRNCRPSVEPLEDRRVLTAQFSVSIMDVPEGDGMLVEILLSEIGEQTTAVTASVQGISATVGTDYVAITPGIITFAPWEMRATFEIETISDFTPETDEEIRVTLSNPANAELHPTLYVASGLILNDDFNFAPHATPVPDKFEWAERPEPWTLALWDVFSDNNDPDPTLTYQISVGEGIVSSHAIDPATGIATFYFDVGEAGISNVTIRATDPYGAYDEALFDIIRVVVEDYEVEVKDLGVWTPAAVDLALLDDDELRWRANFYPITPPDIDRIDWIYKSWEDAADDQTLEDVLAGNWAPGFTTGSTGASEDEWFEWTPPVGDWAVTPRIHFAGTFAQMKQAPNRVVHQIQTPEWQGITLADGQTNLEGNDFFAERNLPSGRTGTVLHNQVKAIVSLDRPVKAGFHALVKLKLFDPDHAAAFPQDFNDNQGGVVLPRPNDNQVPPGDSWSLSTEQLDFLAGIVSLPVTLTVEKRLPGNNFRLAAFNPRHDPADYILKESDGKTILWQKNVTLPVPQSPILTIWRTLYVELDSMGGPFFDRAPGPSTISEGNITAVAGDGKTFTIDVPIDGGAGNQFQGGTVELYTTTDDFIGRFNVASNTTGAAPTVTLQDAGFIADATKFRALEDDDLEHNVLAEEMIPDLSLLASRLAPANIRPNVDKHDLAATDAGPQNVNDLGTIGFLTNVNTDGAMGGDISTLVTANKKAAIQPDFWSVYVLGAFQPSQSEDNDADAEISLPGVTTVNKDGSLVFRETVRDGRTEEPAGFGVSEADYFAAITLHEIGHQFGLVDGLVDGTVMNHASVKAGPINEIKFSGQGLTEIMRGPIAGGRDP